MTRTSRILAAAAVAGLTAIATGAQGAVVTNGSMLNGTYLNGVQLQGRALTGSEVSSTFRIEEVELRQDDEGEAPAGGTAETRFGPVFQDMDPY